MTPRLPADEWRLPRRGVVCFHFGDMRSAIGTRRGSEWRRWDPHLHGPGTLLADRFARGEDGKPDWEAFVEKIETTNPPVSALGITDYFCIRTYKRALALKKEGRLGGVELLFPNVELRLDIKTEKAHGINLHLLFSPEDANHADEIERVLARLHCEFRRRPRHCTEADLISIGRILDPNQTDEEAALSAGANQFKVELSQVRSLFREDEWVRKNCLIAVAGSKNDGTAGLQADDSYRLTRQEIERFAHIIFAATPSQGAFWLGKKADHPPELIEKTYGSLKPCLHGSDAHVEEKVAAPDLDRYCWIKGDPSFEALRQAVLEPEERVWIGPNPPAHHAPVTAIAAVRTMEAPWLAESEIELNPGLVAVIGERGSGKTALVEIIARGAGTPGTGEGESSFLSRARRPVDLLGGARVELAWRDGSTGPRAFLAPDPYEDTDEQGEVCYLSQQFVDRLCSAGGLARELRAEMERVIFEATEPVNRLDTDSFGELTDVLLEPVRRRRDELREEIRARTEEIITEEQLIAKLPQLTKDEESLAKRIEQAKKGLTELVPKGKEARAKELALLEQAHGKVQANVETLNRRRKSILDLGGEVEHVRTTSEPRRLADMRRRFSAAELTEEAWRAFAMVFAGDVNKTLEDLGIAIDKEIGIATTGDPESPVDYTKAPREQWPLNVLRERRDAARKEVGIDADRQKKYDGLRKSIEEMEGTRRRLRADIGRAKGADDRRRELVGLRFKAHSEVFGTFAEEEVTLAKLYEPLSRQLEGATGALAKLEFFVHRRVDLASWVTTAERDLLDLRLGESRLRGHGALKQEAERRLLSPLTKGAAEEVATAMDAFRKEFVKDFRSSRPRSIPARDERQWLQSLAEWLYSTEHVRVEYGIRYDGTAIEQLSPGTRGIVLLLLYLAIDQHDRRPIIIDQPEENLDPKSVFDELVPHFRAARRRRQVIIVTHNANLVVNTDADQVIVASSVSSSNDALPTISYDAGGLENPRIRRSVCETLEGGERAFLERERRYRLRWDEALIASDALSGVEHDSARSG